MSGEHTEWDEVRDARLGSLNARMPPLLREAIERQPPDIGGSHTWVCGCVEYDGNISLCNYHGGYEDALTVIADQLALAVELLESPFYGLPQRALRARTMLEQIRKDCGVVDG